MLPCPTVSVHIVEMEYTALRYFFISISIISHLFASENKYKIKQFINIVRPQSWTAET